MSRFAFFLPPKKEEKSDVWRFFIFSEILDFLNINCNFFYYQDSFYGFFKISLFFFFWILLNIFDFGIFSSFFLLFSLDFFSSVAMVTTEHQKWPKGCMYQKKTRPAETLKCSYSEIWRPMKLKLHQPFYVIKLTG